MSDVGKEEQMWGIRCSYGNSVGGADALASPAMTNTVQIMKSVRKCCITFVSSLSKYPHNDQVLENSMREETVRCGITSIRYREVTRVTLSMICFKEGLWIKIQGFFMGTLHTQINEKLKTVYTL